MTLLVDTTGGASNRTARQPSGHQADEVDEEAAEGGVDPVPLTPTPGGCELHHTTDRSLRREVGACVVRRAAEGEDSPSISLLVSSSLSILLYVNLKTP